MCNTKAKLGVPVGPRRATFLLFEFVVHCFNYMTIRRVFFIAILGGFLFFNAQALQAGHGTHLVISEVQITGGTGQTGNDFVEIYNPTGAAVNLNGIRLVKRTKTGTTDTTLKSWTAPAFVPAHGWYLWANSGFTTIGVTPDVTTTGTITADNGVALRLGSEDTGELVDAVGWGAAENIFVEGIAFSQNPGAGGSLERQPDGAQGNGTDTGDNAADFILRASADPQNSLSTPRPELPPAEPPPDPDPEPQPDSESEAQPSDVVINEFVSNPTDSIEWIELYNNTNAALDLNGWKIYDGTGSSIKTLTGTISARGFLVFELSSARLNNGGDIIILKAVEDSIIDQVSYGDWDDGNLSDNALAAENPGHSTARKSNGVDTDNDRADFSVSAGPTKGAVNVIVEVTVVTETVTETVTRGGTDVVSTPLLVPPARIVINEFVADPEDGEEWVELYNSGEVAVDLEGWWIEEGAERKTLLKGLFIPGQFLIVETIKGNLNNQGDIIRLKNAIGEMVDKITYGNWEDGTPSDNAAAAADPYSVARLKDGVDTNVDKNDFAVTTKVTRGKANVIEAVTKVAKVEPKVPEEPKPLLNLPLQKGEREGIKDVFGKLFISEFIPNPEGSDDAEWIELFWGGAEELDLTGFSIDDSEGGSRSYKISGVHAASRAYLVLPKAKTRLTLNNTSDAVRLFNVDGALVDEIEYEGSVEGRAYARREDGRWFWTLPSPGVENVFDEETVEEADSAQIFASQKLQSGKIQDVALSEVRGLEPGSRVRVRGMVAVLPGILGSQFFYIAGSGIQVYMFKKDFPDLGLGDQVRVEGELTQAGGEVRVKTSGRSDIVVESKGAPPAPHEITADMLGEETEGWLVKLKGVIIDATRSGFTLDDGLGEAFIVVKNTTGIDTSAVIPGVEVEVVGIVGQSASGYRVMPRFEEDIEILGQVDLSSGAQAVDNAATDKKPYAKATGYSLGGAALAATGIRRRKLFASGARAVLFLVRRGGKGRIG